MCKMPRLKSARHHCWPRCVSQHWADSHGVVGRLSPDGTVTHAPPSQFGAIRNAHLIRLGQDAEAGTFWDEDFEGAFAGADSAFAGVIEWLKTLDRVSTDRAPSRRARFHVAEASDDHLRSLVECLVSLAVRSPMNRESAVSVAEHLRGPLRGRERDALIGANMRHCQRVLSESAGTRGKFAVLFSENRELVFGDGFFHNISSPVQSMTLPRMLVPLTPEMAVAYVVPTRYRPEPRVVTLVLTDDEVDALNDGIQVYAKSEVFFRSQRPEVTSHFRRNMHLRFSDRDNPIDRLIHHIPGVPPLDLSLDRLFARDHRSTGS